MNAPSEFPTGLVTIVFTDIEGYSTLENQFGAAVQPVLHEHNELIEASAQKWNGYRSRIVGDAFFLSFARPSDAVQCAVEIQQALKERRFSIVPSEEPIELKVRIGIHTGEVRTEVRLGERADYFGDDVNLAARVSSAGHGQQILVSGVTRQLCEKHLPIEIEFRDLGVHRLKGVGEAQLWQVTAPGLREEFGQLNVLHHDKHNLPLSLTNFIGREEELRAWSAEITQSNTRLMTLCGFGGIGKTRLALQLGEAVFEQFADGVWWITLEDVQSGEAMLQRVAEVLIKELKPQPTVEQQVWNFHRDRHLLLILDNLEQIPRVMACQVIAGLLNAGQHVKVLATSRSSLDMYGEQLKELDVLSTATARTLFAERARSRRANFVLNDSNIGDVDAICARVGFLPLAIELAASQLSLLAPRQILARLNNQLRLLVTRDPTRPQRHLALRDTITWSFSLLNEPARKLLPRLAVFAGGFSVEAAEFVGRESDGANDDVWDALAELRGQSFLRLQINDATQLERLSMLEPVRDYAADLLSNHPNAEEVAERHGQFFAELLEEFARNEGTGNEQTVLVELEVELANLRVGFEEAKRQGGLFCVQYALLWHRILQVRGFWGEARACLETGFDAIKTLSPQDVGTENELLQGRLILGRAFLSHDTQDHQEAQRNAEQALALFRSIPDPTNTARTLNLLGLLQFEGANKPGDTESFQKTQALYEEALANCPPSEHALKGKILHNLGRLLVAQGENNAARQRYSQSILERQAVGDRRSEAITLGNLGVLAQLEGDNSQARHFYMQSLERRRALNEPFGIAVMLNNLGELSAQEDDYYSAMAFFIHAERFFRRVGSPYAREPLNSLDKLRQHLRNKFPETQAAQIEKDASRAAWEDIVSQLQERGN